MKKCFLVVAAISIICIVLAISNVSVLAGEVKDYKKAITVKVNQLFALESSDEIQEIKATLGAYDVSGAYGFTTPSTGEHLVRSDLLFQCYSLPQSYAQEWKDNGYDYLVSLCKKMWVAPICENGVPTGRIKVYVDSSNNVSYHVARSSSNEGVVSLDYIVDKGKLVSLLSEHGISQLNNIRFFDGSRNCTYSFYYIDSDKGEFVISYYNKDFPQGELIPLAGYLAKQSDEENAINESYQKNPNQDGAAGMTAQGREKAKVIPIILLIISVLTVATTFAVYRVKNINFHK